MITIMRKFTDGWCEGELNGKKGMFPSNYVTDLVPPEEDPEEYVFPDQKRIFSSRGSRLPSLCALFRLRISAPMWMQGVCRA